METRSFTQSPVPYYHESSLIPVEVEPKDFPEVIRPSVAHHATMPASMNSPMPPRATAYYDYQRPFMHNYQHPHQHPHQHDIVSPLSTAYATRQPWLDDMVKPDRRGTVCGVKAYICFVVLIQAIIIVVFAGVLGGVASGNIKTSASSNLATVTVAASTVTVTATGTATGSAATPSVSTSTITSGDGDITYECPSADGLNYTAPGTTKVFRRQCNANYAGGEGTLGLLNKTILNIGDCISECALHSDCVGVVFNVSPQCWLKAFIGKKSTGPNQEAAILWQ